MRCARRAAHGRWRPLLSRGLADLRTALSVERFAADFFGRCPVLVRKGALSLGWSAFEQWVASDGRGRWDQLKTLDSDIIVPVEVSQGEEVTGYNDERKDLWQRLMMPFQTFVDAFLLDLVQGSDGRIRGYCAQHTLFDQVPMLSKAVQPDPPYTTTGRGQIWSRNVWLAGGHTRTPIHRDPQHGLFIQVIGAKSFRFFPPSAAPNLYLFTVPPQLNTSEIAGETSWQGVQRRYGNERFSRYKSAVEASETVQVDAGDMLYIPKGWFHAVDSVDEKTMSVNYFWE